MAQPSANNERIEEHIVESTASLAAQNDRPSLSQSPLQASPSEPPSPSAAQLTRTQSRTNTIASIASTRLRSASIKMMEADAPLGMWAAAGSAASKAPTLGDIRRGSFRDAGWNQESQMADGRENQRRASLSSARRMSQGSQRGVLKRIGSANAADIFPQPIEEVASERTLDESISPVANGKSSGSQADVATKSSTLNSIKQNPVLPGPGLPPDVVPNEDGYYIPPKVPWTTSTAIGLRGFFKWVLTPVGFLITLYCCNVVAWGGMLFLLLCNASKAMCRPTCNDINSPRRIWIEIDSQILNALFCVTGFGTIPWRFRDLYWLMVYRLGIKGRGKEQREIGIRRLAGIHRGWFRLKDSENWAQPGFDNDKNPAVPLPWKKRLDAPLTGVRAEPTATWKMDFVVWGNVWNTFLQVCLCGFMWGRNRYNRPSWATGFFIAIACVVAAAAGLMMYHEGKKVKKVEGVPPQVDQIIKNIEADVESGGHSNSDSKTQTVVGTTTPADPEKARTLGKPTSGL